MTLLVLGLSLLGCRGNTTLEPASTAGPAVSPSFTLPPTSTSTPLPTGTPTPLPTNTPVPTNTPFPSPTPTPEGFYVNDEGAFSLVYPQGWELLEEDDGSVLIADAGETTFFSGFSGINDGADTYENTLFEIVNGLGLGTELEAQDTVTFGDGTEARRATLDYLMEASDATLQLVWAEKSPRLFIFLVWGKDETFAEQAENIGQMLASIELGTSRVFGRNRDQVLVLLGGDPFPKTLDPARMTSSADDYIGHLYSGLVRLSPDMQIESDLAERWDIRADGTVYTFTLRSDLAFESGKPIQAADVKYSWERAADPETKSPTVKSYLGDIVGVLDKVEGRASEIAGVQVIDERTLVVQLDGPKPYFLAKLTYPTSYVVDQESVEADPDDWMFDPNASGPFILDEFRDGEAIIFKRNEAYHTPPPLENVVYLLYRVGNRLSLYESGEIDITGLNETDSLLVQDPGNPSHDHLHSAPSMCTSFIALNNTRPPMDDPKVRQAFALAVDKEDLNELFNENLDLIARTILPPAMPGYTTDLPNLAYDPEAARAALEASSYNHGLPPITIADRGYGELDDPITLALMDMWRETLGAEFETEIVDPENAITRLLEAEEHVIVWGWCADYPDPENFLDILFHSQSGFNLVNYENSALDILLEKGRTEQDPAKRISIYNQAESLILDDFAAIPLWHYVFYTVVNPRVNGYVLTPMGAPIIHRLSLAPEAQ